MKRFFIGLSLLVLVLLAGGGYWFYTRYQAIQPQPVPSTVLQAENALALPGTIVLGFIDMDYAVRIDRTINGPEDPFPFLDPQSSKDPFLNKLAEAGINWGDTLTHMVAGMRITEQGLSKGVVLLGTFPVEKIRKAIQQSYVVESAKASLLIIRMENQETCELSDPYAIHLKSDRLVVASPDLMDLLLERLAKRAPAEVDLNPWRNFRKEKVFSVGVLVPQQLDQTIKQPLARHMIKALMKKSLAVESLFLGPSVKLSLPPAINLEMAINTKDKTWLNKTVTTFEEKRKKFRENLPEDLPSLAKLEHYLTVEAQNDKRLYVAVAFNKGMMEDISNLGGEIMKFIFSGFNMEIKDGSQPLPGEEQLAQEDTLTSFDATASHKTLPPFDDKVPNFKADAQTGPFGIRIQTIQLSEKDDTVVELAFEVKSKEILNLSQESMHKAKGDGQAEFRIKEVIDSQGQSLWKEETCGKDRNQAPAVLQSANTYMYEDNKPKWVTLLEGKKSIRLNPGVDANDIDQIKGQIRFSLPTEVETQVVPAPFKGKVVETKSVRLYFNKGNPDEIKYDISGRPSHVLRVQALNKSKQVLANSSASGMDRFGGPGKSVTKRFKGQPAFAEVVVAKRVESHTYSFTIENAEPQFDIWTWPEPYKVQTTTLKAYNALKRQSGPLQKLCDAKKFSLIKPVKPFAVCIQDLRPFGQGLYGNMQIFAPPSKALEENLSAVELVIKSIQVKGKTNQKKRTLPVQFRQFVNLDERQTKNVKHLQGYLNVHSKDKLKFKDEEIIGFGGHIITRLPLKFSYVTLDVRKLGNKTKGRPKGVHAKVIGFSGGRLKLKITGPRGKIVQFIPRGPDKKPLATNNVSIKREENQTPSWIAEMSVSGRPHSLVIVIARNQKIGKLPFQAKK